MPNARNLPFCPGFNKYINALKNNRQEAFIILTSYFNLKFFSHPSHIFIDATFKIAPQNFYQVLNILICDDNNNNKFVIPGVIIINY